MLEAQEAAHYTRQGGGLGQLWGNAAMAQRIGSGDAPATEAPQIDLPGYDPMLQTYVDQGVDLDEISQRAQEIHSATQGGGTETLTFLTILSQIPPEEMEAMNAWYIDEYGMKLDALARLELSGEDLAEAQAALSGNKVDTTVATLENCIGLFNDDEERIEETLRNLTPEELQALKTEAANNKDVQELLDDVESHLGGEDREVYLALLEGEPGKADAIRLQEAMDSSWYDPFSWGTDEEAIEEILTRSSDENRVEDVQVAYAQLVGAEGDNKALQNDLEWETSFSTESKLVALANGDELGVQVAAIEEATNGFGTDEDKLVEMFLTGDPEYNKQIIDAYEDKHGPGSFSDRMDWELSGLDQDVIQESQTDGALSEDLAIQFATDGLGTNEKLLHYAMDGKSKEDMDLIAKQYKALTGEDLSETLDGDLSGREQFTFEMKQKYGVPQTLQDAYLLDQEWTDYERAEDGIFGSLSNDIMDFGDMLGIHDASTNLEYQQSRLDEIFNEDGTLKPGVTEGEAWQILGYSDHAIHHYQDVKDATTNVLSTAAQIVVGGVFTVFLGPVGGAILGNVASILTKEIMLGDAYGIEAFGVDVGFATIDIATAGVMKNKNVVKFLDNTLPTFANKTVNTIFRGSVEHMAEGFLANTYGVTVAQLSGDGAFDVSDFLSQLGALSMQDLVEGVVISGIKVQYTPPKSVLQGATQGAFANMSGSAVSTMVLPSTWENGLEEGWEQVFTDAGWGGVEGSFDGAADYYQDQKKKKNEQDTGSDRSGTPSADPAESSDLSAQLKEGDLDAIKGVINTLGETGSIDEALGVAYEIEALVPTLTPEQKQKIGAAFVSEGFAMDNKLQAGEIVDRDVYDKSHLMGTTWAEALARQGEDPFGNKITDTYSVNQEDWEENPGLQKRLRDFYNVWSDQNLPSTMATKTGNKDRYQGTKVVLYVGDDGVRILSTGDPTQPSMTAVEAFVGGSLELVGPGAPDNLSGLSVTGPGGEPVPDDLVLEIDGQLLTLDELLEHYTGNQQQSDP